MPSESPVSAPAPSARGPALLGEQSDAPATQGSVRQARAALAGRREFHHPEYPFAWHELALPAGRMHYVDEGTGDPVLMLHGNPNWSFYYRHLIQALAPQYRCIAPDHLGCGLSDVPDEATYGFRLSERIDDLSRLIEHLGITSRLTLVVHDWGGMIGCAYAVRHPEQIARLVILNTGAFPLPAAKGLPWQLRVARTDRIGGLLVRGLNAFSRGAVKQCMTRHVMSRSIADAYCYPHSDWARRLAVHRFVQDIPFGPGHPTWDLVVQTAEKLEVLHDRPTFIGWGERDFVFDRHFLAEWARRFPNAEIHPLPDCGHYVLEDAREELIPLIRDFLMRHPV